MLICNFERTIVFSKSISRDDGVEVTLLPIPNRKVKVYSADGTARETVWKSRTLPGEHGSIAQSVEQRTENPRVTGSIPVRATTNTNLC